MLEIFACGGFAVASRWDFYRRRLVGSAAYPRKCWLWRLGKAAIDTGLMVLMVASPASVEYLLGDLSSFPKGPISLQ